MEAYHHAKQDSSVRRQFLFLQNGPANLPDRHWVSHWHRIDSGQWKNFGHARSSPLLSLTDVLTFDLGVA
jgi:hypothetical protein